MITQTASPPRTSTSVPQHLDRMRACAAKLSVPDTARVSEQTVPGLRASMGPPPPPPLSDDHPAWADEVWASPLDVRRRIFCNRSLNMDQIRAVGFDMVRERRWSLLCCFACMGVTFNGTHAGITLTMQQQRLKLALCSLLCVLGINCLKIRGCLSNGGMPSAGVSVCCPRRECISPLRGGIHCSPLQLGAWLAPVP